MKELFKEKALAHLAKRIRKASGKTRPEVARELKVSRISVHQAEEIPSLSLTKLRIRIIERYSAYRVTGPVYLLKGK